MKTKTNSGNSELGERRRRVSDERKKKTEERRRRVNSWGGRDRRAKTKSNSRRSKTGRIERHGNTEKLSCMFILSRSSVCPPVFLCTIYYFAVAPTPASRTTRESTASTRHITRVLITRHTRICYLTCDLYCMFPLNVGTSNFGNLTPPASPSVDVAALAGMCNSNNFFSRTE